MIKTVALEKIFRTEEVETLALNKVSIEVKEKMPYCQRTIQMP